MADQEQTHLLFFENEMVKRKVRPSILMPFWHIAGYALGVITAKMGSKAAMKCTEAVESVIDEHYSKQIALLNEQDKDLKNTIIKFREEEIEHKDTAIKYGSSGSEYQLLEMIIKGGCKLAINLAKKI
jgi:ubiquinone biosynthesis monooxygenase Coq7